MSLSVSTALRNHTRRVAASGAAVAASVLIAVVPSMSTLARAQTPTQTDTPAANLRVTLNQLGAEHVYLAGYAFSAALGGRNDEFKVAADTTDTNTQELGAAIGSVYGPDAQAKFVALWRAHIGFFVDYAMAAATKDDAKKQKARADLDGYRNDIDAFLTGANPNLPKGAVAQLFAAHVTHLTTVIDDMVAGDTAGAYDMLYMAAHQTSEIMDPLSGAIVKQFPDKFPGDPMSPAANLRVALNDLGAEHVYLAGLAFDSALGGRNDEFGIAAMTTDKNTQALGAAIGSVYGADAQAKFLALWRAHIGFFVDYAMGAATKDDAKKQKARTDLDGYRNDIDAFLTGANPNLPKGAVAQLFAAHVVHLTTVVDDIVGGDLTGAYAMLHMAAHQSQEIMNPLSAAIVAQFPEKFMANAPAMTAPDMMTTAPLDGPRTAADGKSLASESAATQAMFDAVWAGRAAVEWVREHNLMIAP
ncbi:MAG: hypothetical protein LC797_18245 [Chloroflexi bacterium]|nr:hypothetical protein [Chloroflexota bacterium]